MENKMQKRWVVMTQKEMAARAPGQVCGPWLPVHVTRFKRGFRVGVRRKGRWMAVCCADLASALRERERLLKVAGPRKKRARNGRTWSNTGLPGVTESVHWQRDQGRRCFVVNRWGGGVRRMDRVYFGKNRGRREALKLAVGRIRRAKGTKEAKGGRHV